MILEQLFLVMVETKYLLDINIILIEKFLILSILVIYLKFMTGLTGLKDIIHLIANLLI